MKPKITKELLFKHFTGKTSAMQKQMIDDWARDFANEEQLYAWLEEYEALHPEYEADLDTAIEKYHIFVSEFRKDTSKFSDQYPPDNEEQDSVSGPGNYRRRWLKWGIAASITVCLGFTALLTEDLWKYQVYSTDYGEIKSFELSDGSSVTLNSNSNLRVPRWGFGANTRKVHLSGEGAFAIKHTDSGQKFIVSTSRKFEIEVLGTEFNVFTRSRGAKVVLTKGKIRLSVQRGNTTQKLEMEPGDLVTLDNKNNASFKTTKQPEMHTAWQGHRYIFDRTTLHEIAYLLAENYGLKAEIMQPELLNQTISGTLTASNADELLELIEGVLEIRITKQDNKVFISQRGQ